MVRAALVAIIVMAIGWTGLDIPRADIEQTVDQQLDSWNYGQEDSEVHSSFGVDTEGAGSLVIPAIVTTVIDGDTADVLIDDEITRLRFIGIDTPETEFSPAGAECYGQEAAVRAKELLSGQTIVLQTDPSQATRDVHGRLLVYAQLSDGRDFGEVMLNEGLAHEYTFARNYQNQSIYQAAQSKAAVAKIGLWATCR